MKALILPAPGGLDKIQFTDVSDPGKPKNGEIRVSIKANSLNFHDLLVARGDIPTENNRQLLSDGAGVVDAIGEGVTEFKVGDRVISTFFPVWPAGRPTQLEGDFRQVPGDGQPGVAAEYVVRPVSAFTHAPKHWDYVAAATIPTSALTAWRALVVNGRLKAGDFVLTQGTGGVSMIALQLAKQMGARVIATSSSNEKLARLKELGANFTINYKEHPKWSEKVWEYTEKEGVDHIIEVGGPSTMAESIRSAKVGGSIQMIGILTGVKGDFSYIEALSKQLTINGLLVGSRQDQMDFVRALETITIDPLVDRVFPAHQLTDAFKYQESGQHFGKICLEW